MGIEYMMHVGICVRDLERSIRFYAEGLGFLEKGKLSVDGEPTATMLGLSELDLHAVYLERDGMRIELLYYARPGTVLYLVSCVLGGISRSHFLASTRGARRTPPTSLGSCRPHSASCGWPASRSTGPRGSDSRSS